MFGTFGEDLDAIIREAKELRSDNYIVVAIDIAFTGYCHKDEVFLVAAFTPNDQFELCSMPSRYLNTAASRRHHVFETAENDKRSLISRPSNTIFDTVSEVVVLQKFIDWLLKLQSESNSKDIVLVYHGRDKCIPRMILKALRKFDLILPFSRSVKWLVNCNNLTFRDISTVAEMYDEVEDLGQVYAEYYRDDVEVGYYQEDERDFEMEGIYNVDSEGYEQIYVNEIENEDILEFDIADELEYDQDGEAENKMEFNNEDAEGDNKEHDEEREHEMEYSKEPGEEYEKTSEMQYAQLNDEEMENYQDEEKKIQYDLQNMNCEKEYVPSWKVENEGNVDFEDDREDEHEDNEFSESEDDIEHEMEYNVNSEMESNYNMDYQYYHDIHDYYQEVDKAEENENNEDKMESDFNFGWEYGMRFNMYYGMDYEAKDEIEDYRKEDNKAATEEDTEDVTEDKKDDIETFYNADTENEDEEENKHVDETENYVDNCEDNNENTNEEDTEDDQDDIETLFDPDDTEYDDEEQNKHEDEIENDVDNCEDEGPVQHFGNPSKRAKHIFYWVLKLANTQWKSENCTEYIFDIITTTAEGIEEYLKEEINETVKQTRMNTFRPLFSDNASKALQIGLYSSRLILIEHCFDLPTLRLIWNERGIFGLFVTLQSIYNLTCAQKQELIELLVNHFITHKSTPDERL